MPGVCPAPASVYPSASAFRQHRCRCRALFCAYGRYGTRLGGDAHGPIKNLTPDSDFVNPFLRQAGEFWCSEAIQCKAYRLNISLLRQGKITYIEWKRTDRHRVGADYPRLCSSGVADMLFESIIDASGMMSPFSEFLSFHFGPALFFPLNLMTAPGSYKLHTDTVASGLDFLVRPRRVLKFDS